MELLLSGCLGLLLAAACGFRVFVPVFCLSLAAHAGHLTLSPDMAFLGSTPALVTLGVATVLEVAAYYLPLVDNLLDGVASPAAIIAGTVVSAATMGDASPLLQWSLALIAGGGAAGAVQLGTVKARAVSAAVTGGVGNPVVSTTENGGAIALAATAILFPALGLLVAAAFGMWLLRRMQPAAAA